MSLNIIRKLRRELYKSLSMICLKQATVNYCGLELKIPLIHGLGSGYLVPADNWMSDCLSIFLDQKAGKVIDIGVNIGLYLVKLKALDQQRAYIGFEPNALCNSYTQQLIRANNFEDVSIYPFALSDKQEVRTFYIRRVADKMGSLNEYARFDESDKFAFDVITFSADKMFEKLKLDAISVIKIDVEGAELEVLKGLVDCLSQLQPFLFCEIWQLPDQEHPTYRLKLDKLEQICALIQSLDYIILGISVSDPSVIDMMDSALQFTGKHRRDYILVHDSEMDKLRQKLSEL